MFIGVDGTRLLAVLTFGGMKRICLPSIVLRLPRPFKTIGFDDDAAATDDAGISILMGFVKYGELIPTLAGMLMLAADVVAVFFFSAKAAAVSKSFPPPRKCSH